MRRICCSKDTRRTIDTRTATLPSWPYCWPTSIQSLVPTVDGISFAPLTLCAATWCSNSVNANAPTPTIAPTVTPAPPLKTPSGGCTIHSPSTFARADRPNLSSHCCQSYARCGSSQRVVEAQLLTIQVAAEWTGESVAEPGTPAVALSWLDLSTAWPFTPNCTLSSTRFRTRLTWRGHYLHHHHPCQRQKGKRIHTPPPLPPPLEWQEQQRTCCCGGCATSCNRLRPYCLGCRPYSRFPL